MKKILRLLICSFLIITITGCLKDNSYTIDIFDLEEIISISIDTLEQSNNIKEFSDKETINTIYDIFQDKTTYTQSINDNPTDPDILYFITFKNKDNELKSVYVYQKNSNYYIEQPYNGIYELSKADFLIIATLANND